MMRWKVFLMFTVMLLLMTLPQSVHIHGIDGEVIDQGSKTYLKNERSSFKNDPSELNEIIDSSLY